MCHFWETALKNGNCLVWNMGSDNTRVRLRLCSREDIINSLQHLKISLNRPEARNLFRYYANKESQGFEQRTTSSLKAKYWQVFDHVQLSKPHVQPNLTQNSNIQRKKTEHNSVPSHSLITFTQVKDQFSTA